ncbi:MAG TPA: hypothetical protein PKO28_02660 [Bacilli bacterium]|nr:hypothetical protein [Bacilli bacterium]
MFHSKKYAPLLKKLAAMDKRIGSIGDFVENEYIDENGAAVINVQLNNTDNLFSPYSDKKVLNLDLMHYIDSQADPISPEIPIIINFIVDDVNKVDEVYIKRAIKRFYWLSYKSMTQELRRITITSAILFAIGIGITVIYQTLSRLNIDLFANEIILIVSWICIWEAFNRFTFNRRAKQIERMNEGQMAVATVRFQNIKDIETPAELPNTEN